MALSDTEFSAILANESKRIVGDIIWHEDEDRSPSVEFRAEVESDAGWPLFVRGSYNRLISALSYVVILKTEGRIYGLDLGKEHHNPQCDQVGRTHKHRWTENFRDKQAHIPDDITAPSSDPVAVWRQFCDQARLKHNGTMKSPPPFHEELFP